MRKGRFATLALMLAAATFASSANGAGVPVEAATPEQRSGASDAYAQGKAAFDAGDYARALEQFRASHDIVASPNARLMVVAALTELGRTVDAYEEVVPALAEAEKAASTDPKYASTVETLEEVRGELRAKVGLVTIDAPPDVPADAALTIDGQRVEGWSEPIAVEPGSHLVELPGYEPRRVEAVAGGEITVPLVAVDQGAGDQGAEVEPAPVASAESDSWFIDNRRIIAYSAGGVGAAGMIVFGVFGGLTMSAQDDLDEACTVDKRCPQESAEDIDDGKSYQTAANVGLVIGIVGLAAGTGLLVWDLMDEDTDEEGEPLGAASLKLRAGAGYVGLEGSF